MFELVAQVHSDCLLAGTILLFVECVPFDFGIISHSYLFLVFVFVKLRFVIYWLVDFFYISCKCIVEQFFPICI